MPAPGERDRLELGPAARDAGGMDRRRSVDRAAVGAAPAEQLQHLLGAAGEQRALGRHAHRDHLARGRQLAAGPQHLGVGARAARSTSWSATAAAPGTGASAVTITPVVRPPPVPTIATTPGGVERARSRRATGPRRRCRRPRRRPRGRRAFVAPSCGRRCRRAGRRDREATTPCTSNAARCSPTSRTTGRNISSRNRRGS